MRDIGVDYQTLMTDNADEAVSLADYLNGHGVLAVAEGNEVTCPLETDTTYDKIGLLKMTWRMRWDHFDSTLLGLPIFHQDIGPL